MLAYLSAVGDELPIYRESGLAPPLFGVALALGQILKQAQLPPGAIHSLQEFDTLNPMVVGSKLRSQAFLERRRERGGLRFLTFAINLIGPDGNPALNIKTTLLVPVHQVERQTKPEAESLQAVGDYGAPTVKGELVKGELVPVSRRINQGQVALYSTVSGDNNPLHLDSEFASGTQFGGIIAHGMLTLAFISEMMAGSFGEEWLSSGSIRARFKGAAYPGDHLETWGKASRADDCVHTYAVGLNNSATGVDLISGTATVRKN